MVNKFCYSLLELAKRWSCTENDILHLAARKKLWLSVNLNGYGEDKYDPIPISGWWQLLIPSEIGGFFPNREEAYFTAFRNHKDNTYRIIKTAADDQPVKFLIHRNSIVVMAEEVKRYETENPPSLFQEKQAADAGESNTSTPTPKKGGRKKGPLAEAVECAYLHFKAQGNTEILRQGKIREFLTRLKELRDEYNENHIDYISERIKEVKIKPSGCLVITEEQILKTDNRVENILKSKTYQQTAVSKILASLRQKNPI